MFNFSTVELLLVVLVPLSGAAAALYLGLALRGNARRREGRP